LQTDQPTIPEPELGDISAVCQFWGGNRPVHPASIYRQISEGKHPKPIKVGNLSRWVMAELREERTRRMEAR
jgi:predicted DNA-binding transcriptional regulator AlpA